MKSNMRSWQQVKYALSSNRLKECAGDLGALLTCPTATNDSDLNSFQFKKNKLTIELSHLRMTEDR